jgi:putative membrane protein
VGGDASTELASNRTSLAVERTRMGADRTLMAIIRTALSLIGFGFTVSQAFRELKKLNPKTIGDHAAHNFGLALVLLGVLLLVMGLVSHAIFGREINRRRERLFSLALLRRDIHYHATPTFITAILLLLIGLAAALGIAFRMGIFE